MYNITLYYKNWYSIVVLLPQTILQNYQFYDNMIVNGDGGKLV